MLGECGSLLEGNATGRHSHVTAVVALSSQECRTK
jgi:hypothetical protein